MRTEADTLMDARGDKLANAQTGSMLMRGEVVKLDRSLPTVKLEDGRTLLCEHAVSFAKGEKGGRSAKDAKAASKAKAGKAAQQQGESDAPLRPVIGDIVEVSIPSGHDAGIIADILPRRTRFTRKDPTERAIPQVLAANFDQIIIVQPVVQLNLRRLERELVLAFESGAKVAVVLTKADLAQTADERAVAESVRQLTGPDVPVLTISSQDLASMEGVRQLMPPKSTTVLMGRSGVGKSTLVNALYGAEVQKTADVREGDGKGRHTTVNRQIIELPDGARIIDMPGVRGLGLWEADTGIDTAFADIESLAESCRFRDCKHVNEPGCAVRAALSSGDISQARYDSYIGLRQEVAATEKRRQQKSWKKGR